MYGKLIGRDEFGIYRLIPVHRDRDGIRAARDITCPLLEKRITGCRCIAIGRQGDDRVLKVGMVIASRTNRGRCKAHSLTARSTGSGYGEYVSFSKFDRDASVSRGHVNVSYRRNAAAISAIAGPLIPC